MLGYLAISSLALLVNIKCERSRFQAAIVVLLIAGTGILSPDNLSWFIQMAAADLVAAIFVMAVRAPEYRTITMLILMDSLFQLVAGADAWLGTFVLWDAYTTVVRITELSTLLACILLSPVTVNFVVSRFWRMAHGGHWRSFD